MPDFRNYRFNGGYGAVTCSTCNIIIDEGLSPAEYLEHYQDPVLCVTCKAKASTVEPDAVTSVAPAGSPG